MAALLALRARAPVFMRLAMPMMASHRMSDASGRAQPREVLDFWLGPDYASQTEPDQSRIKMWFTQDDEVDAVARSFIPEIRAAGTSRLNDQWEEEEGRMAQLILLDQLSRNAFRGEAEAYAYDERAQQIAMQLIGQAGDTPQKVPTYVAFFVVTCLMHSESLELHAAAETFAKAHVAVSGSKILARQLDDSLPEHTEVLRRFGRYPHRNNMYGRHTTADEEAWLASDECPGWAKSQTVS